MRKSVIIVLLTARTVYADCTYHNGYYDPGLDGACVAESTAPAGCPVHFVTPRGQPMAMFTVHRGTQDITLPATTSIVETVGVPLTLVDPVDCDCAQTNTTVSFDRQAVMLTGASEGDTVEFAPGHLDVPQIVAITATGPCPAVVWPTQFAVATQCDRCPTPPPSSSSSSSSSCSTSGGGSWLAVAIALGLVTRRRRPHGSP